MSGEGGGGKGEEEAGEWLTLNGMSKSFRVPSWNLQPVESFWRVATESLSTCRATLTSVTHDA